MLHIYRQISALERVHPIVVTQKRENAAHFPFNEIDVVPRPTWHFLRRFWTRQVINKPWQISTGELRALTSILNKSDTRLLHIYFGHIAVHLLPLIRAWTKPSIVSFHGADVMVDMEKPHYRTAAGQMLEAVKLVLVRSESLRRAVAELGCDEKKIELNRTGIPLDEFPFRERTFPSDGQWRLVQACRLIEKKGLPITLHAFTHFLQRYPKATITIAGEGPLLTELRELTRKLKIDDRVALPGFVSQEKLREIFYASHIFLHPSETGRDGNQEGIPNSMLEAMASGLPVFASKHGGIPEAIEDAVTGILVPERDVEALTQALLDAAQDRPLMAKLARCGAKAVRERFDLSAQVRRLEEIYLRTM